MEGAVAAAPPAIALSRSSRSEETSCSSSSSRRPRRRVTRCRGTAPSPGAPRSCTRTARRAWGTPRRRSRASRVDRERRLGYFLLPTSAAETVGDPGDRRAARGCAGGRRSSPRAASPCCARQHRAGGAQDARRGQSAAKASKSTDDTAVALDRPRWRYLDATASVVPPSLLNESHARRIESAAASGEGAGARGDDASSSSSSSARGRAPAARRRATVRRRSRKEDRFAEAASIFRRCASASSDWCLARFTAALRTRSDAALALARVRSSASSCEEWVRSRGERAGCEVRERRRRRVPYRFRRDRGKVLVFFGLATRETSCLATVFFRC